MAALGVPDLALVLAQALDAVHRLHRRVCEVGKIVGSAQHACGPFKSGIGVTPLRTTVPGFFARSR